MAPVKTVLVIEDDATFAAEITSRLRAHGYEVEIAGTLARAREATRGRGFDAAVVDVQLPDGCGLDLLPLPMPALVLTILGDEQTSYRALVRGANGYLVKPEGIATLGRSIDELLDGGAPMSPRIARWLLEDFRVSADLAPPPDEPALTRREREVVEYFATGATYAEIARALGITVNTVRTHVKNIYTKLHVASKTEAVLKAMPNASYAFRRGEA